MGTGNCILCGNQCEKQEERNTRIEINDYDCPICGKFGVTNLVENSLTDEDKKRKLMVCARERYIQDPDNYLKICETMNEALRAKKFQTVDEIIENNFPKTPKECLDRALLNLSKQAESWGDDIKYNKEIDYPILMAETPAKADYVLSGLRKKGYFELNEGVAGVFPIFNITPEGYEHIEELKEKNSNNKSIQAFVAMYFNSKLDDIYDNGIKTAVEACGFNAIRIDKEEHNNKICDEIIVEIKRSRFLIADFTGHRCGVYFEAGFALGLEIPVIWTCEKRYLDDAHFDTRQYNHIDWTDVEELKNRLISRIRATIPGAKLNDSEIEGNVDNRGISEGILQ